MIDDGGISGEKVAAVVRIFCVVVNRKGDIVGGYRLAVVPECVLMQRKGVDKIVIADRPCFRKPRDIVIGTLLQKRVEHMAHLCAAGTAGGMTEGVRTSEISAVVAEAQDFYDVLPFGGSCGDGIRRARVCRRAGGSGLPVALLVSAATCAQCKNHAQCKEH